MSTHYHFRENEKSNQFRNELQLAIQWAIGAGAIAKEIREKGYDVKYKDNDLNNPVTDADVALNAYLNSEIQNAFPEDVIISEEDSILQIELGEKRIWFVDPIDGTKEFIKGLDEWSVMIGMVCGNQPVMGVVYQPDSGFLYYAVKKGGSFFHDESTTQDNHVRLLSSLSEAVLIQSQSHLSVKVQEFAEQFGIYKTRQQGSIGLKIGMIARGEADLYLNLSHHCHLWDLCGPQIILEEAGGLITFPFANTPILYRTLNTQVCDSFLASTPMISKILSPFLN